MTNHTQIMTYWCKINVYVENAENTKETVTITSNPFVFGRGRRADFRVNNKLVSSTHAAIKFHLADGNRKAVVEDYNTTNGIIVDGRRIARGDSVGITVGTKVSLCRSHHSSDCPLHFEIVELFDDTAVEHSTVPIDSIEPTSGNDEAAASREKMGEELTCGICQEIVFRPASLVPCLHSFCGPCAFEWLNKSHQKPICPVCRTTVSLAQRNHQLNNLVEMFLVQNPSQARDSDDLKEMIELDKRIPSSGVIFDEKSKRSRSRNVDDDDEDDDVDDANDSGFGRSVRRRFSCQLCLSLGSACCLEHKICKLCGLQFPFVGAGGGLGSDGRQYRHAPSQCALCSDFFCHNFYATNGHGRCPSPLVDATTQLAPLTDHNLDDELAAHFGRAQIPPTAFGLNEFERQELEKHLRREGVSFNDVFLQELMDLRGGQAVMLEPVRSGASVVPGSMACAGCARHVFGSLLLQYALTHVDISAYPRNIRDREDCWYGYACRTQTHNQAHREKFNHLCEPSLK